MKLVRVHVGAGRDIGAGKADGHVVLADRFVARDRAGGDLVAGGHLAAAHDAVGQLRAQFDHGARDEHVVVGMQADRGA
jgi:hypothetical protein